MKITKHPKVEITCMMMRKSSERNIFASMSSRDITKNMVRVRSSNVWAYAINLRKTQDKTGDVYIQFKGNNGGPGDVYCYYDVPVVVYRRMVGAPSKGHFFWQYIRNNYKYAKLTGDKKTRFKNGVNYSPKRRPSGGSDEESA